MLLAVRHPPTQTPLYPNRVPTLMANWGMYSITWSMTALDLVRHGEQVVDELGHGAAAAEQFVRSGDADARGQDRNAQRVANGFGVKGRLVLGQPGRVDIVEDPLGQEFTPPTWASRP